MKRYVLSARNRYESDYSNTDVLLINLSKAGSFEYNVVREILMHYSENSNYFYVHVDSEDQYTVYIDADKTNADQIKNLIQNEFKSVAALLSSAKMFT